MKKFLCAVLIMLMACGCLCSCGAGNSLEITLNDGTVKNMTAEELYNWKEEYVGRNFSEFEGMVNGATISGTGTVTKVNVHEPDAFLYHTKQAIRFQTHILLDNGVALYFTIKCKDGYDEYVDGTYKTGYPELDLYENDKISFRGTLSGCDYNIEQDGVTIDLEDIDIGEKESIISLEKIVGVELVG